MDNFIRVIKNCGYSTSVQKVGVQVTGTSGTQTMPLEVAIVTLVILVCISAIIALVLH